MREIEIFAHGLIVTQAEDAPEVYLIRGQDWEGQPFSLYLNEEEARNLIVQLGFQVYERDRSV